MKRLNKILSVFLALLMAVSIIPMSSITVNATSTKTKEQAVAWINSRVGNAAKDMDGYYATQCVDFIQEYYSFLGVSGGGGNACNYSSNTLPSGFTRIKDYYGFVPEPGDIAVWSIGWNGDSNGHVGVVISADLNGLVVADVYGSESVEGVNWNSYTGKTIYSSGKVHKTSYYPYSGGSHGCTFWGIIRPAYASSSVATTGITLNASPFTLKVGESKTVSATVTPSNATNKNVTWSSNNTSVATVSSSGVVKAVGVGACTITAKASGGQSANVVVIVKDDEHSPIENATYNGHYYELYDEVLSWKDAKEYCESLGGHLVTITSQAENDFVQALASNGAQTNYYIGGTDEEKEGTWKWVTDEDFSYINLGVGEPSSVYYEDEDYLFIGKSIGKWGDVVNITSGVNSYGFICEYEKIDGLLFEELPEGADPDDYELVKAYRSRNKQTTTSTSSTLDGWTLYDSQTTYGTWSGVQSTATKPTESDTLQITGTWKQYHYYHYCNYYDNQWNIDSIACGSSSVRHDTYLNQKLPAFNMQDQGGQQAYGGQGASGATACDYNFYIWFYAGEKTFYNYQTRTKSTTNYFYKWSDWSNWTESPIASTDTREVQSKNLYRLKDETTTNPSGTCGENATWEFDEATGTLTISGTGEMLNAVNQPWEDFRNDIIAVVIEDGITTIGNGAFENCSNLTNVTIPESVISMGDFAFSLCGRLIDVVIPQGVTTIRDYAFYLCEGLTSIVIPESVISIGEAAFYGCFNLTSITVDVENLYYSNDEYGVLFNKDKTKLVSYPAGNQREAYSLPKGTSQINNRAFSANCYISEVVIPDSMIKIDHRAFENCTELSIVNFSEGLEYIGEGAFWDCRRITNVIIPKSVSYIGDAAFGYTDALQYIKVDEASPYYSNDEFGVLFNKDKTVLVQYPMGNSRIEYTIPSSVKTISAEAFWCCIFLESVVFGDNIEEIEHSAFYRCEVLTDIYYCGTEKQWGGILIDGSNESLFNATIHYNYNDPTNFTGIKDDYFYKDGVIQRAYQLVEFEGNYYFINNGNKIAKNTRIYLSQKFVEGTSLTVGYYDFDADGKLVMKNGPDGDYFYRDGIQLKAYQLVEFEGDYYFINNGNKIAKNQRIYLGQTFVEGTPLAVGYYEFGADGKMAPMNGPVGDYFYKDGVRQNAYQLVEYEGNFYFVNDSHKLAKNKRIYLTERFTNGFTYSDGTPITPGYYDFDENGKMVFNGPIGDYFYKDGAILRAYQLVEYKGDFYFINDSHKLAKNKRIYLSQVFVEGTTLAVGYYEFGADGKMAPMNGPVGDYFYKDGTMLKAYQLVEFEGSYYFINDSNKLAKNKRVYLSQTFVEGTGLEAGYYEFDANGKMIIS